MKTMSPSDKTEKWNHKTREVYCGHCKYYIITKDIPAICEVCSSPMITVIYSIIDGSRITGNNELVK